MKPIYNPNILTFTISFEAFDTNSNLITSGSVNFYVSNNQDYKQELKRQSIGYFSWYETLNNLTIKITSITKQTSDIENRLSKHFDI